MDSMSSPHSWSCHPSPNPPLSTSPPDPPVLWNIPAKSTPPKVRPGEHGGVQGSCPWRPTWKVLKTLLEWDLSSCSSIIVVDFVTKGGLTQLNHWRHMLRHPHLAWMELHPVLSHTSCLTLQVYTFLYKHKVIYTNTNWRITNKCKYLRYIQIHHPHQRKHFHAHPIASLVMTPFLSLSHALKASKILVSLSLESFEPVMASSIGNSANVAPNV